MSASFEAPKEYPVLIRSKLPAGKSGGQGYDVVDHPLKYRDREIVGVIADSVFCKTAVAEPRIGDYRS